MIHVDPSAVVSTRAIVGEGSRLWGGCQIRENVTLGRECIVGRGVYIGPGVRIGDRVKFQNLAQIYEPAVIGTGVFVGPGVILTNDLYPRAITPDGRVAGKDDWTAVGVTIHEGASIGARTVCVAPVVIGRWAMVGAGSTVLKDVPDHALVAGTPARFMGWVGRSGRRLIATEDGLWECPVTRERYAQEENRLSEVRR